MKVDFDDMANFVQHVPAAIRPNASGSIPLPAGKNQVTLSRQPGYLLETRGFPSLPRGGFGFLTGTL
jgi:hypothetical protein